MMSNTQNLVPPYPLSTAVLFLIFNRLDTTKQVFEAIRQAKPPRLYVAADGPRESKVGEAERVQAVRDYVIDNIDWDCEVKTLFREKNLGCKYAVSNAITWFFENEEQGIILEDDCLPSLSFFWFCEELLIKYRHDYRVMSVCGTNIATEINIKSSYFFSRYALMWGWASWARAWKEYDLELISWRATNQEEFLKTLSLGGKEFFYTWNDLLQRTCDGQIDTWDYQWIFSCWRNNGLTALPKKNLIRNLGFSIDATHTLGDDPIRSDLRLSNLSFPLSDPSDYLPNRKVDKFLGEFWFNSTWKNAIKLMLRRFKIIRFLIRIKRNLKER